MERKKKRHYIYLAGNISEDPRTYEWRENFTELMEDSPRVIIVNPCANIFNQNMRKLASKNNLNGLEFTKEAMIKSQKILRAKDYQLVKMSSAVVVNLALYSPEKPMIGTVQELCWCRDIFYIPVLAICNGVSNIYTTHPWISECCSAKVDTVEEAVKMVKVFFLDY